MKEQAIDARVIGSTVKIEVCKKVEKKYRLSPDDSLSTIYARALEDASREVILTKKDYAEIEAEMDANRTKRQHKRSRPARNAR